MSDEEFEIMDELYFVISHAELQSRIKLDGKELNHYLFSLIEKGWINYFTEPDSQPNPLPREENDLSIYYFLASKKGLFEHNSR